MKNSHRNSSAEGKAPVHWLFIGIIFSFLFCIHKAHELRELSQVDWWQWILPSSIFLALLLLIDFNKKNIAGRAFNEIKSAPSNVSHLAAVLRNWIFKHQKILSALGLITIVLGSVLIFFAIWGGISQYFPALPKVFDVGFISLRTVWTSSWGGWHFWGAFIFWCVCIFWGICFLLVALNPRSHEDRKSEIAQQKLDERLEQLTSELTQMNLAVAALHVSVDGKTVDAQVDEIWLRELDIQLKVKESLVSVEKIILARQRDVGNISNQIKENKEKARRAVTSSISGVGAGFLTYELGGAIKNFTLLKSGSLHPAVEKTYTDEQNKTTTVVHEELMDLNNKYRQPELVAEATLLTITFIVSMLAAFIGWQKSLSE